MKQRLIIIITLALCATLATPSFALASNTSPNLLQNGEETVEDLLASRLKRKLKEGTYYLLGIEKKLASGKEDLKLLKDNIASLENRIEETKTEVDRLESQLANFDRLISNNHDRIRAGTLQQARLANEVYRLQHEMKELEKRMKTSLQSLNQSVSAYYFQTNAFFGAPGNEPSLLAFLSSKESSGEIFQQTQYLSYLRESSEDLAREILTNQETLDRQQELLEEKEKLLNELDAFMNREKRTLMEAKTARTRLLNETKGKQAIYETLLELSKKEESQVALEISRLKENFEFFEAQLAGLKEKLPEGTAWETPELGEEAEFMANEEALLAWPVSPTLGLTAFFRDSEYKKTIGIEHNAIDIRVAQGSKVKAAGDGVVTKVVDNGFAYSYVIIAHPDKIITLYGHLSEIFVNDGEIVRRGQAIGLSGGIPGTKGAGWLTTGAHLHFEVFKNFTHDDPLEYLPLEYVPLSSLPEKYLEKLTGENRKIRRK